MCEVCVSVGVNREMRPEIAGEPTWTLELAYRLSEDGKRWRTRLALASPGRRAAGETDREGRDKCDGDANKRIRV